MFANTIESLEKLKVLNPTLALTLARDWMQKSLDEADRLRRWIIIEEEKRGEEKCK